MKINYFEECGPGYFGPNCTFICIYPGYGDGCQGICECDNKTCDIFTGCRIPTTGILMCSKITIKYFQSQLYIVYKLKKIEKDNIGFQV